MPLNCKVCKHPDRAAIERDLIRGTPLRDIAKRVSNVSKAAIHRHKRDHLGAALLKAKERRELASGTKVLSELEAIAAKTTRLYDTALQLVEEARGANDRSQALQAMDRAIALLREARTSAGLIATITGELGQPAGKGDPVAVLVYPTPLPPGAPYDLSHRPPGGTLPATEFRKVVSPVPASEIDAGEIDEDRAA